MKIKDKLIEVISGVLSYREVDNEQHLAEEIADIIIAEVIIPDKKRPLPTVSPSRKNLSERSR